MIIVNKNEGEKIPYTVRTTKITFDDDLTINLAKREKDDPVHIDICADRDGELVIGAAAGRRYVAEIDIPARRYETSEEQQEEEGPATGGEPAVEDAPVDTAQNESEERIPVPLDMNTVTLSLWALEEE